MVSMLILWVVVIGLMWFLLMRPQKKEQKRVQAMLASMEVGDTALTTSGFYGVIIDITDDDVIVEFGIRQFLLFPNSTITSSSVISMITP